MNEMPPSSKKTSKLNCDNNWDFIFAKSLTKATRWILTLPMGLLGILLVYLAFGIIVAKLDEYNIELLSIGIRFFFMLIQWMIFIQTMTGMAPVKNKFRFSCFAAFIPVTFYGITLWNYFIVGTFDEYGIPALYFIIPAFGALLGTIYAMYMIRKTVNQTNKMSV